MHEAGQAVAKKPEPVTADLAFDEFKTRVRWAVEEHLDSALTAIPETEVCRAARYSVLGGGHRWRAMGTIAAGLIFREDAFQVCIRPACAVELVHAASIVLDDLPSMDNARIRRGKACVHLEHPRWAVDMLPAYLVNTAYSLILDNPEASYHGRVAAGIICSKAGAQMGIGQELDLTQSSCQVDPNRLLDCYRMKSGALYAAATGAGALVCGADPHYTALLSECGMKLGLSYQFLDDIADVDANVEETGKSTGMDVDKYTAVDLFGIDGTKKMAYQFEQEALSKLEPFGPEANLMRSLIRSASWSPI